MRETRAFCSATSDVANGPSMANTLSPLEEVTSTYQPRISTGTPTLDHARTLLNGTCRTTQSSTRTLPSPSPPSETGHPSAGTLPRKRKQPQKSHPSLRLTETPSLRVSAAWVIQCPGH